MYKFSLPEKLNKKGRQVVGGQVFIDNECLIADEHAKSVANILVRFHGCSVVKMEEKQEDQSDDSLSASVTKPGQK